MLSLKKKFHLHPLTASYINKLFCFIFPHILTLAAIWKEASPGNL